MVAPSAPAPSPAGAPAARRRLTAVAEPAAEPLPLRVEGSSIVAFDESGDTIATVLRDLAPGVSVEIVPEGVLVGLGKDGAGDVGGDGGTPGPRSSFHQGPLGELVADTYLSLARTSLWWISPSWGTDQCKLSLETQLLLAVQEGGGAGRGAAEGAAAGPGAPGGDAAGRGTPSDDPVSQSVSDDDPADATTAPPPSAPIVLALVPLLPLDGTFKATLLGSDEALEAGGAWGAGKRGERGGHAKGGAPSKLWLRAESGSPAVAAPSVPRAALLVASRGASPAAVAEAAVVRAAELSGAGRGRRDKAVPAACDALGWCTWNAAYSAVDADVVFEGVRALAAGGAPPRLVIIDDGWQQTRLDAPFPLKKRGLFGAKRHDEGRDEEGDEEGDEAAGDGWAPLAVAPASGPASASAAAALVLASAHPPPSSLPHPIDPPAPAPAKSGPARAVDAAIGALLKAGRRRHGLRAHLARQVLRLPPVWKHLGLSFDRNIDHARRLVSPAPNGKFSIDPARRAALRKKTPDEAMASEGGDFAALSAALREGFGVRHLFAWHAAMGYWAGVAASSSARRHLGPLVLRSFRPPEGIAELDPSEASIPPSLGGIRLPLEIELLHDRMHALLQAQGITGVKIDVQSTVGALGGGVVVVDEAEPTSGEAEARGVHRVPEVGGYVAPIKHRHRPEGAGPKGLPLPTPDAGTTGAGSGVAEGQSEGTGGGSAEGPGGDAGGSDAEGRGGDAGVESAADAPPAAEGGQAGAAHAAPLPSSPCAASPPAPPLTPSALSPGGPALTARFQASIESSVARHFGSGNVINCMCHSVENLFNLSQSNWARASDDFYPNSPASQTVHVAHCSFNSLLIGALAVPDYDMFFSKHPAAPLHAAARAVSGGPVYVSDAVGAHDFGVLARVAFPDGTTLRALRAGVPAPRVTFRDVMRDGETAHIVVNANALSGVALVANLQGAAYDRQRCEYAMLPKKRNAITVAAARERSRGAAGGGDGPGDVGETKMQAAIEAELEDPSKLEVAESVLDEDAAAVELDEDAIEAFVAPLDVPGLAETLEEMRSPGTLVTSRAPSPAPPPARAAAASPSSSGSSWVQVADQVGGGPGDGDGAGGREGDGSDAQGASARLLSQVSRVSLSSTVTSPLPLAPLPASSPAPAFVAYRESTQTMTLLASAAEGVSLSLSPAQWDLVTFVPIVRTRGGRLFAPIGCPALYNLGGAVLGVEWDAEDEDEDEDDGEDAGEEASVADAVPSSTPRSSSASGASAMGLFRGGGRALLFAHPIPTRVLVAARAAPDFAPPAPAAFEPTAFAYESATGALKLVLPGIGAEDRADVRVEWD